MSDPRGIFALDENNALLGFAQGVVGQVEEREVDMGEVRAFSKRSILRT